MLWLGCRLVTSTVLPMAVRGVIDGLVYLSSNSYGSACCLFGTQWIVTCARAQLGCVTHIIDLQLTFQCSYPLEYTCLSHIATPMSDNTKRSSQITPLGVPRPKKRTWALAHDEFVLDFGSPLGSSAGSALERLRCGDKHRVMASLNMLDWSDK